MSKQWIVEAVKTEYPDLYLYNVLEPNPDAGKSGVCYAGKYFSVTNGLDSAENARLIAAAPELHALAEHVVAMANDDYLNGHPEWIAIADEARALLTKIEGV
jgi:hypothetical protein